MFQTFWAIFSPDNCGKVSVYLVEKFDHRYMPTNGSCEQPELIVGSGWGSVSRIQSLAEFTLKIVNCELY